MKRNKRILFTILFSAVMIIGAGACKKASPGDKQAEFDRFMQDVFCEEVKSDSITLNYTLANPENYGIKEAPVTFGEYGAEYFEKGTKETEGLLKELSTYEKDDLTENQKLTYDILNYYLKTNLEGRDFTLYSGSLSPTIGIQAELPILLEEFSFYDADDIKTYLELLTKVDDYFKQVAAFEKERSEAGLGMTDFAIEDVISQCESFIKEPENNVLIVTFSERIAGFSELNEDDRLAYEYQNQQAVVNEVVPAYKQLIADLNGLKGMGKNQQGLCYLPDGKKYYEHLIKSGTGSDRSIKDMKKLLDQKIMDAMMQISMAYASDNSILDRLMQPEFIKSDPSEILSYLEKAILDQYPAVEAADYSIKYVHESMQDDLSPAFFLTPALDNWEDLSIYINQNPDYDQSTLFTTLAHEGYPGHLYQNIYFMQTKPEPIRSLLSFGGYSEGWASYVEMRAYEYGGLEDAVASALSANRAAVLAISSRVDIGIHYDGWDEAKTAEYLMGYGLLEEGADATEIYQSLLEEPGNYLRYTIGYLEFEEMRVRAEKALGDKFDAAAYHAFLLDLGPAPFSILNDRLDGWLKANK